MGRIHWGEGNQTMNNIKRKKDKIKETQYLIKGTTDNEEKDRLNRYKQRLEIELRNYTSQRNGRRF